MGSFCSCIHSKFVEISDRTPTSINEPSDFTEIIPDELLTASDTESELKNPRHFEAKASTLSPRFSLNNSLTNSNLSNFIESVSNKAPLSLVALPSLPQKILFSPCSRFLLFTYQFYIRKYCIFTNSQEVLFTNLENTCIAMNANLRYIAIGSGNRVFIWNLATGKRESELVGHFSIVTSIEFSNDGKHIISASEDNSLRIWKLENSKMTGVLRGHHDKVICLAVSYDSSLIASGSTNGTVIIWSISQKSQIYKIEAHENEVTSVAFANSTKYCLSGGKDLTLKIWSIEGQKLEDEFVGLSAWPREIKISSDDGYAIVLCEDMTLTAVNLIKRAIMHRLEANGKICTMMMSDCDASFACGREKGEQAEVVIYG